MKPIPVPFRILPALAAALLAACVIGSGGHGDSLPEGHYFVAGSFDSKYAYERYFVVLPDRRYEWVEYGTNAADNRVCKVTRQAGTYGLGETRLGLVREKDAGPAEKCGFTASDFQAMKWTDREEAVSTDFEIRNVGEDGFEAKDFFSTGGAYHLLSRRPDPYGFFD